MTTATGEVSYLVLADRAAPYLLARVRWPDIAQAITVGCPDWIDDPGLFDLPYDPSGVTVSFPQAASVAAAWGRQLRPEAADGVPSFIRRMPANWTDLSPAERRALGIEFAGKRRIPARSFRRNRRLLSAQASVAASESPDGPPNGYPGSPDGADIGADADGLYPGGRSQAGDGTSGLRALLTERRHMLVPLSSATSADFRFPDQLGRSPPVSGHHSGSDPLPQASPLSSRSLSSR